LGNHVREFVTDINYKYDNNLPRICDMEKIIHGFEDIVFDDSLAALV